MMSEIMEKRGNGIEGKADQYIFRYAKGSETPLEVSLLTRKVIHQCNNAMKRIALDLDIPHLSTYSARHSFATILQRSGADISFISECLGHTSLTMTENYLAGYGKEERLKYSKVLLD